MAVSTDKSTKWLGAAIGCGLVTLLVAGCYRGFDASEGAGTDGLGLGHETDGSVPSDDGAGDDGGQGVDKECEAAVGSTPLRRLTRAQYDNAVRDLLGLDENLADRLPPDEKVGTFDANVAPISEILVEDLMAMAEELAIAATADPTTLLPCDPALVAEPVCGAEFIRAFGRKAYRRPLTDDENARYFALFEAGSEAQGFGEGVRYVIEAMLQSFEFLYHVEQGRPEAADPETGAIPLTDYEIAARLSFFLWDSIPDDALLASADIGELSTGEGIVAAARRMLGDDRAKEAVANFHRQWLQLDALPDLHKDADLFPAFDAEMHEAMAHETDRFTQWVTLEGDGRMETLFTASVSFPEGPLLALYGVEVPEDHTPGEPIPLDPTQRSGILTHAAVLATHAHPDQTSPVFRGKFVRENLLCQALPPPPPDVDDTPPEVDPNATTRERFDQHTTDPQCAGCHQLIDPIGLAFEHYDPIGGYRETENGLPIDATGTLIASGDADGPFDGAIELAGRLAHSDDVRACLARQWFRFGLHRRETKSDACTIDALAQAFSESDGDINALILAIVGSRAFRSLQMVADDADGS